MIESLKVVELLTVQLKNVDQYFVAPFFVCQVKNLDYGIKKETVYSDYICRLQAAEFSF